MLKLPRSCQFLERSFTKDNRPRYVGQTNRSAESRLDDHLRSAEAGARSPLYRWIRANIEQRHQIRVVIIDVAAVWNQTERQIIAQWRDQGIRLLNVLDGGDDTPRKFVQRKRDRRALDQRVRDVTKEEAHPAVRVKKRRKKTPVTQANQLPSKKAQERAWLYGKMGAASEVRVIPVPSKPED